MNDNKNGFIYWVKAHRKQLVIITGLSVAAIIGIILGLKNKEAITELWTFLKDSIKKAPVQNATAAPTPQVAIPVYDAFDVPRTYTSSQKPFDVSQHIRTMSRERQHSIEKAIEAASLGIELLPNQTLVAPYTKRAA